MIKLNRYVIYFLLMAFTLIPSIVLADNIQNPVDWKNNTVTVTGMGVPPDNITNMAQAHIMARRAAIIDGYRNLLEAIDGINVESNTTVQNFAVTDDNVKTSVSGLIQGARIINEQALPDGSYQVTMQLNLYGNNSVAAAVKDAITVSQQMPFPNPSSNCQLPAPAQITPDTPYYTGIVIDARGLELSRVMAPRIYDETGRIIYGNMYLDSDFIVKNGMVDYLQGDYTAAAAAGTSRAGSNPIIIKATALKNFNADIVISQVDADMILSANMQNNFLTKTAVVFEQ